MPLPTPNSGESQDDFVSRCMGNDTTVRDFPEREQRAAVCYRQWREGRAGRSGQKGEDVTVRTVSMRANSINEEERSIEAVLATEAQTGSYDVALRRAVDEVWLMDGAQLPEQIPLLDSHPEIHKEPRASDSRGSIRNLRIEDGQLVGRLFFASDAASENVWGKYRDGHLDSLSLGVERIKTERIPPGQTRLVAGRSYRANKRPLYITQQWRPLEGSTVIWGFDPGAKVRQDLSEESAKMNKRLRAFLESIGLRSEAGDDDARTFLALQSGRNAQIANLLESEGDSETSKFAVRAALEKLGVDPEDPSKSLTKEDVGKVTRQKADDADDDPAPPDADAVRAEAVKAERERVTSIRKLASDDVPAEIVTRAVDEGWDESRAAAEFLGAIRANRTASVGPAIHSRSREQDITARSLTAGLLIGQGQDPLKHSMYRDDLPAPSDRLTDQDADRGHALRGLSSPDLVRECLRIDTGKSYRTVDDAILALRSASTSTGTLSYVFGTNVYARLMAGWETIGDTTVGWCDEEDVANFLEQEDISVEGQARLERLPRGDTAKHATISDSHETYKIARYAKQFVVDEQDIIDDRLGAIMRMPEEMGEAARQHRPDMVYSLMLENPNLVADSGAVFNATAVTTSGGHANLGTAALASGALKSAITAMVQQRKSRTASDPGHALTLRPRFLIVPAALEWTARELTASAALAKLFADSSDPWYAQLNLLAQEGLRVVVDDRIGAIGVMDPRSKTVRTGLDTNWFLTAGGRKGLRVAYRRGTGRRPAMRRFTLDRGQWGIGWDINLDIGVAFLDYRPWYKSTGAA